MATDLQLIYKENPMQILTQLIHPAIMLILFAYFLYTGYLGWQTRRTRTAQGELKKQLIRDRYHSRHYALGAIVLGIMVVGSIGGIASTYFSYGELTVDAHLIVGLVMTALIAISASLSPFMQKGNAFARNCHIGINVSLTLFFGWQTVTGLGIVQQILFPTV
jgi:Protein of unknown function (DUF4079)